MPRYISSCDASPFLHFSSGTIIPRQKSPGTEECFNIALNRIELSQKSAAYHLRNMTRDRGGVPRIWSGALIQVVPRFSTIPFRIHQNTLCQAKKIERGLAPFPDTSPVDPLLVPIKPSGSASAFPENSLQIHTTAMDVGPSRLRCLRALSCLRSAALLPRSTPPPPPTLVRGQ